jgi:predicted enzyme related to lactoylglutathione lyase
MPTVTTHAPGTFCWLDLAAHDAEAAKRFYTQLFGWEAADNRYGPDEGDVYTMYRLGGKDVAASYGMDPNQKMMGMPSAWLCYVAVADAGAAAAQARSLGATVVADAFDVMDSGRMALVQDPTGALIALWQPNTHRGMGLRDEAGTAGWFELATNDTARAKEFYTALFGWTASTMDTGVEYTVFHGPTGMAGGMYGITKEMGEMPPCWLPYFVVDGTEAAIGTAKELGGAVLHGPMDMPGVGRTALLQDPQGAAFYVITLAAPRES